MGQTPIYVHQKKPKEEISFPPVMRPQDFGRSQVERLIKKFEDEPFPDTIPVAHVRGEMPDRDG
ncbi:MAG: hypothetical protein Q4E47_00960 [Candidatus Saccharibacteria bacterium]|nr:hypothetical protein [Candidatus Saccharibacteria bacterium]